MAENIQQLFDDDVKIKKQTGSGVFKRKGKGVKNGVKGGLRFAYQNMSKQDRADYTHPSVVVVTSMDDLLAKDEFLEQAKYTGEQLREGENVSDQKEKAKRQQKELKKEQQDASENQKTALQHAQKELKQGLKNPND